MEGGPISILVSGLSGSMVQQKSEQQRYNDSIINIRFFLFFSSSSSIGWIFWKGDENFSRRIFHGRGWEVVAIIVITITPVINDSEDSFFDCYALYLIISWRKERARVRWRRNQAWEGAAFPSIPLAALLNVFQVFSCAQQSCCPTIGGLPAALCPDN